MVLTYDLYSRSPLNVLFNPDTDTLSTGNLLTANASVRVGMIPEPQTWTVLLAGIGLLGLSLRRQSRRTATSAVLPETGHSARAFIGGMNGRSWPTPAVGGPRSRPFRCASAFERSDRQLPTHSGHNDRSKPAV